MMKISPGIALLVCLAVTNAVHAQKRTAAKAAILRARFIAAFGSEFDLVRDRMTTRAIERGGGTYWLAYVKPKHTGDFKLQYRYRDRWPTEIEEHETHFSVYPQGCRRGTPNSGVYGRFCMGDTIIVPVLVNNFPGHEFKLTKAEHTDGKEETADNLREPSVLDKSGVADSAAPVMRYCGRSMHRLLHRIPGYTLTLHAHFQAQEPGRMNLFVIAEGQPLSSMGDYNGAPIVVLPREAPATLIAGYDEVRGYGKGADGKEFLFSTSRNGYMTNVLILQPGDYIDVAYYSIVRGGDFVKGRFDEERTPDPSEKLKPVVSVRPFAPDSEWEFTEWLVDSLPRD